MRNNSKEYVLINGGDIFARYIYTYYYNVPSRFTRDKAYGES